MPIFSGKLIDTMTKGWSQIEFAGHAAEVFEPSRVADERFAVLYLHEYGGNRLLKDEQVTAALDKRGVRVLAPAGGVCGWLDRPFAEFDPLRSPLDFLEEAIPAEMLSRWNVAPPGIGLCGFEIGGQGVLQLAYRKPRQYPVVAAISPAVDFHAWYGHGLSIDRMYESKEDARQSTVILKLHPLNWPAHQWLMCDPADLSVIEGVERLISKLNSSGILNDSDIITGSGGDRVQYLRTNIDRVLEYILHGLEFESRRLV
ncbi:MAG: hypothetical protein ACKVT0_02295 [Planctomycetaceae bacterium]